MITSRVNPINVNPGTLADSKKHLARPVQSTSVGIRVGDNVNVNIGYIQKFNFDISRPSSEVYQIEPCVNGTFGYAMNDLIKDGAIPFFETKYHPGEVIEVIPGKQGAAELSISRAVLYGSNLMSALMYIERAGTESIDEAEAAELYFGGNSMQYVSLIQQVRPIFIKQVIYNPISGKIIWGRVFQDVWIESWSEEMPDASKNEILVDSIKAKATRIRPLNKAEGDPVSYTVLNK